MLTDDEIKAIRERAAYWQTATTGPTAESIIGTDIPALLADRRELVALIRRWSAAHDAARACPQMILSSGRTDEAAALMRECDAADEALRAAGLLEAE